MTKEPKTINDIIDIAAQEPSMDEVLARAPSAITDDFLLNIAIPRAREERAAWELKEKKREEKKDAKKDDPEPVADA